VAFFEVFSGLFIRGSFESFQSTESFLLTTKYTSKNYKNCHLINKSPVFFYSNATNPFKKIPKQKVKLQREAEKRIP
jgi:hypothetical protein